MEAGAPLRSPLASVKRRRAALWLLAALTLVFGAAQLPSIGTMQDHGVGVVEFELMRTTARTAQLLADLGQKGRDAARTQLWLDYGYLISYGLFLSLACTAIAARARDRGNPRWRRVGEALAWGALGAALFDAIENAALLRILAGHAGQPYPAIAFSAAIGKFALSTAAIAYALAGWVALRRRTPA
ncbi:MAG: hypothetical protein QOE08_1992 [Thermoleophilaceae bacterium]|jgi:hypothetical protein|nr:hypothetical protein [Thermoleophilaceae bacterium]